MKSIRWLAPVILAAAGSAAAENLLANPGFEELKGAGPARWQCFVMPQEGARGWLDANTAHEGAHAAALHIPKPYAVEPANNWSQNVMADLQGRTLRVRGHIRTEDATEAAIWLQCFRGTPFAILTAVTTSADSPVYGTKDWTPVAASITVPAGTDYVVVRCVLKGSGTAWFDDISLETITDAPESGAPPTAKERPEPSVTEPSKPSAAKAPRFDTKALADIVAAQKELVEANRELRESNEALAEQFKQMREELKNLREQILGPPASLPASPQKPAGMPAVPRQEGSARPAPPLVPRGFTPSEGAP